MSKFFSREVTPAGKVYALDKDQHFIKALKEEIQGTHIETMLGDITQPTLLTESSAAGEYFYMQVFQNKENHGS
jgi:tRNA A58 N-methylase Trm61